MGSGDEGGGNKPPLTLIWAETQDESCTNIQRRAITSLTPPPWGMAEASLYTWKCDRKIPHNPDYVKNLDTEIALDIESYTKFISWNKFDASTAGDSEGKSYNYTCSFIY